jgi:hypothetical protein
MPMNISQRNLNGTVHALTWFGLIGLFFPMLLFAAAAWKDRATILHTAEADGFKIAALFSEQASNLIAGHEMILDTIADRMQGRDWATFELPANFLAELEVMDNAARWCVGDHDRRPHGKSACNDRASAASRPAVAHR